MMPAPQEFVRHGRTFRLLAQSGRVALYETRSALDQGLRSFEVHILRQNAQRAIAGKLIRPSVRLAADNEFGIYGFSCTSLEAAQEKFKRLTAEPSERLLNES